MHGVPIPLPSLPKDPKATWFQSRHRGLDQRLFLDLQQGSQATSRSLPTMGKANSNAGAATRAIDDGSCRKVISWISFGAGSL